MSNQFIIKNTMADMRALSALEITGLKDGTYNGVQLLGYHNLGDTPEPILYFKSNTSNLDDGGSVIRLATITLEHQFLGEVDVKYYGLKLDGTTDESDLFESVINNLASKQQDVLLKKGSLILNREIIISGKNSFKICGHKDFSIKSTLSISSNGTGRFLGYFLRFNNCTSFTVENINFIINKQNAIQYDTADYPNEYNGCIYASQCGDFEIVNNFFNDLYTKHVFIYQCYGKIDITKNKFYSSTQVQNQILEFLTLGTSPSANINIENNKFNNAVHNNPASATCGIFAYGLGYLSQDGSVLVKNNVFNYCGRDNTGHHRLCTIDFYDDVRNFIVENNIFNNNTWGAIRFNGLTNNAIIKNNVFNQSISNDSALVSTSTRDTTEKFENIDISGNIFNGAVDGQTRAILLQSPFSQNLNSAIISENTFNAVKNAIELVGGIKSVVIKGNYFKSNGNTIEYKKGNTFVPVATEKYLNFLIEGNSFYSTVNFCDINTLDIPAENINQLLIANNILDGANSTIGLGFIVNGIGLDKKVMVSNNNFVHCNVAMFLRCEYCFVHGNTFYNCLTPVNKGGKTTHILVDNYNESQLLS